MSRRSKLLISIISLVMALLMVATLFAALINTRAAKTNKQKLVDLKSQLTNATAERKQKQKELNELYGEIDKVFTQKLAVEQEINITMEQIDIVMAIIDTLELEIQDTIVILDAARADEEAQYQRFRTRIRAMYEHDTLTTLDLILSAGSFTEVLSRLDAEALIVTYDRNLILKLADIRKYIDEQVALLESEKAEQDSQKADLEKYEEELSEQYDILDVLLYELDIKTQYTEAELASLKAEEAEADKAVKELAAKIKKEEEAAAAARNQQNKTKYTGGQMTWPLPGYYEVNSAFGMRKHPITGVWSSHTGIDIPAPKGTPIVAAGSGTVVSVGDNSAYGNRVIVNHGGGIQTLYAHMSKIAASQGQEVSKGTVLGYVGSTGNSTGNHLHFGVLEDGSYVNPIPYLTK